MIPLFVDNFKWNFSRITPHLVAVIIFIAVSCIYFYPRLNGYFLHQSDYVHHIGMSKEIQDFRETYHSEPLWTNSMFGGMPAYQITTKNPNIINSIKNLVFRIFPMPIGYMLLLILGFYILLICMNVDPWLAIAGSVAFGLTSINILYLATGHNAKIQAISFIPPMIGSIIYAYRKNRITGSVLLSIFICLHLTANHVQMTYYFLFLLLAVVIAEFIRLLKENKMKAFIKTSVILIVAAIIGILPAVSNLMVTYEYGKHTTRGKSEITVQANDQANNAVNKNALDKDYIKKYSLGNGEIWSLVIPNAKGGSVGTLAKYKEVLKEVKPGYREAISRTSSYWGEQYSSGGAFYMGAVVFLLFVLGMAFVKDNLKWALLAVSILAILLSLKYSAITDFFIDHFPLYNKFRDTKMMLVIVQLSFPLLGFLFMNELLKKEVEIKKFVYVSAAVAGIFLIVYLKPEIWFGFLSRSEKLQLEEQTRQLTNNPDFLWQLGEFKSELIKARVSIFKDDCLRSLIFMLAAFLLMYLYLKNRVKKGVFLILLSVVIVADIWAVDKRYLNNKKNGIHYLQWVKKDNYKNPYRATRADMGILNGEASANPEVRDRITGGIKDIKGNNRNIEKEEAMFRELNFATNYRVFSLLNPFVNSRTSYFHKSLGGYHGAKLRRYQDLIDFHIMDEYSIIVNALRNSISVDNLNTPVLNMLNTRYIIYDPDKSPIVNPNSYGNAWFVNEIKFVDDANEEILALKNIDDKTAVVQERYSELVNISTEKDSAAFINLISYKPNHLVYESQSNRMGFAVFSEIYYPDGWNAYIDSKPAGYIKANYALRGMTIPPGKHLIEFKFEPGTYYLGRKISIAGSGLIMLFLLTSLMYSLIRWVHRNRELKN